MNLQDYRKKYSGLSQRDVRHLIESEPSFKSETEELYRRYFRTNLNKRCPDCWMDAFVLLVKTNIEQLMKQVKAQFKLKAGALLRDARNPNDDSRLCSQANLTDELAIYHLRTNPSCARKFEIMPDNWEELVKAAEKDAEAPQKDKGDKSPEEKVKAAEKALKSAKSYVSACETNLRKAKEAQDEALIEKKTAALEKAVAKFEAIKSEYEALVSEDNPDEAQKESDKTSSGEGDATEA